MLIERLFPVWGVWIYYGAAVGLLLIISVKLGLWLRKAEREYKIEQARRELVGAEVAIRAGLAEGNIYTAWGPVGGPPHTCHAGPERPTYCNGSESIEPSDVLIKTFIASNWSDAMRQYHEYQQWEPYREIK
jgi:hypothetical protein